MEQSKLYCYKYPRPAITTDCVIWGWAGKELQVLLVERGGEPFRGCWALPGGFMGMEEDADTCAKRELEEETGLKGVDVKQFYTFSAVNRDPRYRVVSIAYYAFVEVGKCRLRAGDDVRKVQWFGLDSLPALAFDHQEILQKALAHLKKENGDLLLGDC